MTLVNRAVSHASLSWTHSSAKTKYDLFLNEITLSGWADVACRNTVHELPVGLTSLYIRKDLVKTHSKTFKTGAKRSESSA